MIRARHEPLSSSWQAAFRLVRIAPLPALLAIAGCDADDNPDGCNVDDDCPSYEYCWHGDTADPDGPLDGRCWLRELGTSSAFSDNECGSLTRDASGNCVECTDDAECVAAATSLGLHQAADYRCVTSVVLGEVQGYRCVAQVGGEYCGDDDWCVAGTCVESCDMTCITLCENTCASHDDCPRSYHCDGSECWSDGASGSVCTDAEECASNHCEAGVCAACTTSDQCGTDQDCSQGSCVPSCTTQAVVVQGIELKPNAAGTNPYGFDNIEIHLRFDRPATVEATRLGRSGVTPEQAVTVSTETTGEGIAIQWHEGTGPILLEEDVDGFTCQQTVSVPQLTAAQRDAWSVPAGWQ